MPGYLELPVTAGAEACSHQQNHERKSIGNRFHTFGEPGRLSPRLPGWTKGSLHGCCMVTSLSISSRHHFVEGTTSVSVKLFPPNSDRIVTYSVLRG
jgi:hypothetical protein